MTKGSSIADAIIINAKDSIAGVTEEHNYIKQLSKDLQIALKLSNRNS